ncbi:transposase, partial [Mucilaginibacter psychrotolerans]
EQLERGNLSGIYVLSRAQQELRSLFRQRQDKVQEMVRANNRLKSCMMFFGVSLPESVGKKEYLSLKALAWLDNYEMNTPAGKITLRQYAEDLKYQRKQLYQTTKLLHTQVRAAHARTYECIISIPGVGATTAMAMVAEIADFSRFKGPDEYCSFLGLCPWEDSSGDIVKTKGMQPRCNRQLRPLLIEASWAAIKKSPVLFAYYSKHAAKNSKAAIVKVSRKVALTIRAVALNGQPYQAGYAHPQQQPQKKTPDVRFSLGMAEQQL